MTFWIVFSVVMFAIGYLLGTLNTMTVPSMSQISQFRPVQHIKPVNKD